MRGGKQQLECDWEEVTRTMQKHKLSTQVARGGARKKKQKGDNIKSLPPNGVPVMGPLLDEGPNLLLQVDQNYSSATGSLEIDGMDSIMKDNSSLLTNPATEEKSRLHTGDTVNNINQRDLNQSLVFNTQHLEVLRTYSRRVQKSGQKGMKKSQNSSNWNLQETGICNGNSAMVNSEETGFGRKKNNDVTFREGFLALDEKQSSYVKEETQADPASKVSTETDLDFHKEKIITFEANRKTRRRGKRKKNKASVHENLISLSEKEESVSMKSESLASVEKIDLHLETMKNNINQKRSATGKSNGLQRSATIVAAYKSYLPRSLKCNVRTPEVKCTYSKRHKKAGQQELEKPHSYSYLDSQANENDRYMVAAETGNEKNKNNNASFSENFLDVDKKDDGSSIVNVKSFSTSHISSVVNSNIHEEKIMHPGSTKRARKRRKKNKTPIHTNPTSVSEKEGSGSTKSEIIDSLERSELCSEICSNSEMSNTKPNSGRAYARRRHKEKKKMTRTVTKDDARFCDGSPLLLEDMNEDFCQMQKDDTYIEEKFNHKDEESHPSSSVKNVTDDVKSDAAIEENVLLDDMPMPLQRVSSSCSKKKLLVLDLNGLLVDVTCERHSIQRAPIKVSGKSVFKRPFCDEFLEFCFERFDIGIWSSRRKKNIDAVVNFVFGDKRSQLLFCWDESKCTTTGFKTIENVHKPLVLKELKKLWNKEDQDLPWEEGDYSPFNTLLIDDSPYKALVNPPHTAIFPSSYSYRNENDNSLGLEGDIRVYLEGLAVADDVQSYVKDHPFGQHAIAPGNPSWAFYLQIVEKTNPIVA